MYYQTAHFKMFVFTHSLTQLGWKCTQDGGEVTWNFGEESYHTENQGGETECNDSGLCPVSSFGNSSVEPLD